MPTIIKILVLSENLERDPMNLVGSARRSRVWVYNDGMDNQQRRERLNRACDHEDSWQEWYALSPLERWHESMKLWQFYLQVGGSLDPEPDSQSPFNAFMPRGTPPAYGRAGLRVLRRGRV